jgi:tetraacyldisaccharide 4'-kinase
VDVSWRARLEHWLNQQWYERQSSVWPLRALVPLYQGLRRLDQWRSKLPSSTKALGLPPLIVIGNLNVGGSGKTPLVIWLVQQARAAGFQPGVISRGYGSMHRDRNKALILLGDSHVRHDAILAGGDERRYFPSCHPDVDWRMSGDEAYLIAQKTAAPVAVCSDRLIAALALAARCDLLICDDGLQNFTLPRDLEILVIDGVRRFGNGLLLPAGPLREAVPKDLAARYPLRVCNGGTCEIGEFSMRLSGEFAVNTSTQTQKALNEFGTVQALAGIGNPERFYQSLRQRGLQVQALPVGDHAQLSESAWQQACAGAPLLMTEKDALKYPAHANAWAVPVRAEIDVMLWQRVLACLQKS